MEQCLLTKTFQEYLAAVKSRDIHALRTYLTQGDTLPFVDGGGTLRLSMTEYLTAQESWFADTSWTYESEVVSCQEYDETGIIIDRTAIHSHRNGQVSTFHMMVTYVFRKEGGQWRLVTDICTAIA